MLNQQQRNIITDVKKQSKDGHISIIININILSGISKKYFITQKLVFKLHD